MKTTAITLALTLAASSCGIGVNNGNLTTVNTTPEPFNAIHILGACELSFSQADTSSVTIECTDRLLPLISAEVPDGSSTLTIQYTENVSINKGDVKVTVTSPTLNKVKVDGAAAIELGDLKTSTFECEINGAAAVDIKSIDCESLAAIINGAGSIKLAGNNTGHSEFNIMGTGVINAQKFSSASVSKTVSGIGIVRL